MEKVTVIVAGGSGTRMAQKIPKQFLLLKGRPLLMHTIKAFHEYDSRMKLILVLMPSYFPEWSSLCQQHKFQIPCELKPAGNTRFHSVKNGIEKIPDDCLVAIHDGVRPLVNRDTIERCFITAEKSGNAIPCIAIPETLRKVENSNNIQVDRNSFRLIQTPQVFEGAILKRAYNQEYKPEFTDDASVVENMGYKIHLVEGNPENIKITIKMDLKIAEALMDVQQ